MAGEIQESLGSSIERLSAVKINEISVRRKINLGNYESIEVSASVVPSPLQAMDATLDELITQLDGEVMAAVEKIMGGKA